MADFDDIRRDLEVLDAELVSGLWGAVSDATSKGAEHAKTNHAWKDVTGESARGITRETSPAARGSSGVILATGENLMRLITGTRPHDIRPKAASGFIGPTAKSQGRRDINDVGTTRVALRWSDAGGVRFAQIVHHPGTAPDPFMDDAATVAFTELDAGVDSAVEKVMKG